MLNKYEMIYVLTKMLKKGEISNKKKTYKSSFDNTIQLSKSEYEKAITFVENGTTPKWLIKKMQDFKIRGIENAI